MNAFIIDLTHGGVKISIELAKLNKYKTIYSYDLYNTLKEEDKNLLEVYNIKLIKNLDELKSKIQESEDYKKSTNSKNIIINPIHSPLNLNELLNENKESFEILTHHEGVKLILENWKLECEKQDVKCIELTGVKGKTSTTYILKEIFQAAEKNMLLLSSLGSHLIKELGTTKKFRDLILEKNISITPASILKTVELAKKVGNPKCSYQKSNCKTINELEIEDLELQKHTNNPYANLNYKIALFESSLGVTGLGDIAILTNIVENYTIAKGRSNAQEAKKQIFNCPLIVAEEETLDKFYKKEREIYSDKINTFSINIENELKDIDKTFNNNPNLIVKSIDYQMDKTKINIQYRNLRTITNKLINGDLEVISFALGEHHIKNIITAITAALSLNIDKNTIKEGLLNFKGIPGRTSIRLKENSRIIEEINPGINTKAIESSIKMLENINDYYIIIGGKYGVTCEEIDEDKLSKFLEDYLDNHKEVNLILTDELGKSLKNKLNKNIKFIENYEDAQKIAISENKDILFIYRSNYSQISKR